MTVAMMSRITLHLKKEAHRTTDPLGTCNTHHLSSSIVTPSPIDFAHARRSAAGSKPLSISITEYATAYDDRGREIGPKKKESYGPCQQASLMEEWIEFAPIRNADNRSV